MKNRIMAAFMAMMMGTAMLTGCGSAASGETAGSTESTASETAAASDTASAETASTETSGSEKYSIVCTTFPQYDWVKEILGDAADKFEVTYLMDNGTDLHSFQPSAEDIMKIGDADLFIYVGGESDDWVEDALKNATNSKIQAVNMLEAVGDTAKEEEVVEGMQAEEEEHEGEGEEEEIEYDEHVWLSLKNAQTIVTDIADKIELIDTADAQKISDNADAYNEKLSALDVKYAEAVEAGSFDTVLFGDRFPFRYLVDDYGIKYYAAFVGCSAESEASFETISFLAGKVDELGLPAILTIENSDQKIANTIKENTKTKDQEILVMDSLQSVSSEDIENGKTYLGTMTDNLETLKKALN
ncbi:MAG: metal ABC transporter substrate-binding protein [Lachnospiraceae bacterium]|nr:metal ABC transporter substrate-binding protein [Lachnospiraceae bacterium]